MLGEILCWSKFGECEMRLTSRVKCGCRSEDGKTRRCLRVALESARNLEPVGGFNYCFGVVLGVLG